MQEINHNGISERVLQLLELKGISRYKLAEDIDVDDSSISKNINNKSTWGFKLLLRIAVYFDVSLDWLILGKEKDKDMQVVMGDLTNEAINKLQSENAELKKKLAMIEGMIKSK